VPETLAVRATCSPLTAFGPTQAAAFSSSAWPFGSVPSQHDELPLPGQTVNNGEFTWRA
jgi:hypothetical protein